MLDRALLGFVSALLTTSATMELAAPHVAQAGDGVWWQDCSERPSTDPAGWERLEAGSAVVAADAVLPLPAVSRGLLRPEEALAYIDIEIRAADGLLVAGVLEAQGEHAERLLWRPSAPWSPGAAYTCTIRADNAGLAAVEPDLSATWLDDWAMTWEFIAEEGPTTTVSPDEIEIAVTHQVIEQVTTGSKLVCCDGAYPVESQHGGSLCDAASCGSLIARGELAVGLAVASSADPAARTNSLVTPLTLRDVGDQACVTVRIHDFTAATAAEFERCVPRPPGVIGLVEHDPTERLARECKGELYTCGVHQESDQGYAWNPDDCTPWPDAGTTQDDAAERGCACTSGVPFPPWWVAIVAVALRRRRRTSSASSGRAARSLAARGAMVFAFGIVFGAVLGCANQSEPGLTTDAYRPVNPFVSAQPCDKRASDGRRGGAASGGKTCENERRIRGETRLPHHGI